MATPQNNPYAPPAAHVEDVAETHSEAEAIRREHIKHEASVRSIGILDYIGGSVLLVAGIGFLSGTIAKGASVGGSPMVVGALYVVLGVLSLAVGYGVRALRPWARIASIVLSAIGLLAYPVGTIVNVYILWLLLSKKGRRIFKDDYAAIVAATPHVKYRTSMVVWIILGIVFLGIAAAIVIPMLNR